MKTNVLRQLLSLAGNIRRLILFNALVLVAIMGCFVLFIGRQTATELEQQHREELTRLDLVASELYARLSPLFSDVRILASSSRVVEYLRTPSAATRQALKTRFRVAAEHRNLYAQLRLLDRNGQELVRVDQRGHWIEIVPDASLQDKSTRYYVMAGQTLQAGEVYVSPLDLNIEDGQIEYPHSPTLRVLAPVFFEGELRGMVVINYKAATLLQSFAANMLEAQGEAMLLDAQGYWLHSADSRERFGFQLPHGLSFAQRYPAAWHRMDAERGQFLTEQGWFGFVSLFLGDGEQRQRWYVVSRIPQPVFFNAFKAIAFRHLFTLLAVVLAGLGGVSLVLLLHLREQENQRRFQQLVELQPDAVLVHRRSEFLYWNQAALDLLGMRAGELHGCSLHDIIAPEFRELVNARIARAQQNKSTGVTELEVVRADGTRVAVETRGTQIEFDGEASILAILSDITERRENQLLREQLLQQVQRELHHSEERLRMALQSAPISVYQQDRELRYIWVANLSDDATFETLIGKRDEDLLNTDEANRVAALKRRVLHTGQGIRDEVMIPIQGRDRWFQISAEAYRDEQGLIMGITGAAFDITNYKEQERLLAYHNNYDPLTDLPNRTLLVDRLKQMLFQARSNDTGVAVITVDVNHFKRINDSLGYTGGDVLLQQIAVRLREVLLAVDTVARVAADRFVILFEPHGKQHIITAVNRKILAVLGKPFVVQNTEVVIGCSLGISVFPEDGTNADGLLSHAEAALHQARSVSRRATYQFYDASLHALSDRHLQLETGLRQALEKQQLHLLYQPQLDLHTQRIIAVEALARWKDPIHGDCPPDVFIPLAEESDLIQQLGDWVLTEACSQQLRWAANGLSLRIAVNISSRQLTASGFVERVEAILRDTGASADNLELEITETALMENLDHAANNLEKLRDLGFHLAVDDFGTGYSSLSYLRRLPVHCLKIDRGFVGDMENSGDGAAIVRAIIAMAHALRLYVVAEGVETREQLEQLSRERCDLLQGYFLAKPMAADEITVFCKQFPGRSSASVVPIR